MRSGSESGFVFEVTSGKESKILPTITLCSEGVEVELFAFDKSNQNGA